MNPTPYPDLNIVLGKLVDGIQSALGGTFLGAYLQGSFAVGDFDQHSDVDFIVVLNEELSPEQVDALQDLHERVYNIDIPWAQHLEGSYFPKEILRDAARAGCPLWYLDHGSRSLIELDHCNTVLVRWVVREHGVALAGPSPAGLVDPIPAATLRREIRATMKNWGQYILDHPDEYNNRFYQGYIVLNFSRMLHDLIRGYPGSKRAGAEWAKVTLDPSWAGLINRAWDCRPDPATSVRTRADPDDYRATLDYLRMILDAIDTLAPEERDAR